LRRLTRGYPEIVVTSGKVSKRRRREARVPPPPVKRPGGKRQASPKVLIGVAVAVTLIVLAIVLGFVLTGGSSSSKTPARGSLAGGLPGAAEAQRLFKGIPQNGNVLGSPNAPVTLVEYVDLQCPFCQEFETKAMPKLLSRYVRNGKVKIEARPIAFIGPDSERGRDGALAAAEQNRLFDYMQLLYLNQGTENTGWLDDAMANAAAASIPGLDVRAWSSARGSSALKDQAIRFDNEADADNVTETPTVLVGRTGGKLEKVSVSLSNIDSLSAAIENTLR
jgi:protein-disulfide isomerase